MKRLVSRAEEGIVKMKKVVDVGLMIQVNFKFMHLYTVKKRYRM
jgi:hypothetical protein